VLLWVSYIPALCVGVECWLSIDESRQFRTDFGSTVRESSDEVLVISVAVNGEDFEVAFFLFCDVPNDLLEGWSN
jgi:hypothetical protein